MAESYRGLTIRIGGDTTKLSQALKGAERSASDTQSVLRKLNDAVKLDPSNIEAANMQMGAMASSAAATAMKLVGLREAIKQVGSMEFDGKSVQQLSEETRNAQINANIARESYNKLTESLAQMYTKVTDLVGQQAKLGSAQLATQLKKEFDLSKVSVDDLKTAIDGLAPAIKPSVTQIDAYLSKVTQLKARYLEAAEAEKEAAAAAEAATTKRDTEKYQKQAASARNMMVSLNEQFDKLTSRFSQLTGEVFNFDNGNVSLGELRSALENLPESIRPNQVAINNFISEVARLKSAFKEADSELEKANIVAQFEQLTAEATKTNAAITSLVHAMANMKMPSELLRGMTEQTESAKALGDAYSENMRVGKEMADAYKADPTNVEALAAAERAFAAAAQNANENLVKQREINGGFDKNRAAIDAFTDSTKSAQEQLNEAIIAQAKAADETARLEGNIAAAELRMKELGGTASKTSKEFKDKILEMSDESAIDSENAEEYNRLSESTRKWREELKAAEVVEKELAENVELAKQRKEFEESEQSVIRWSTRIGEALDAARALRQTEIAPRFDTSSAEQFDALLKQLSGKSLDSTGFGEVGREIEALEANIKAADDQLRILDEALKVDPTNLDLLEQKTTLVSTKIGLASAAQDKLNKLIKQLETTQLDKAAIQNGTLAGKLAESKKAAEDGSAAMKSYEKTISELEKELEQLNRIQEDKRTDEQKQKIANLTAVLESLKNSYKIVSDAANQALQQMNVEVRTQQYVDAKNKAIELAAAEKKVGEEAKKTHEQDGTPKIDEAAFMQVVDRVAQAARRMASEVVQASNEIDSAYRDMRKTVNGTEEDFENLRERAIEYSKSSFTSADQMLQMQALGGQLGVAVENLEQFGKIASNLDIATDIDADTVALKLGQISNILGLDIEGMQGFSDALVRLGNNMPAQESAIMAVAQRFGAVAATANFSGDEVLGWSAAIAATGQRSEAAATAISNTVSGIEQAVANGGNTLKQFAAIAGMSSEEFVEAWKESPTQVLRGFIKGLETLKDSDESAVAALENMGITGVRQQQTLLALTQTIDSLDEALAMSSNAWKGINDQWGQAGDAAIEAGKKAEGFSGALQIMQNNAQNLAAAVGDGLVPFMRAAADVMGIVTDALNSMPQPVKELVVLLGGATIAFSTITPMLNIFSKGMVGIVKAAAEATSIGQFVAKITGFAEVANAAGGAGIALGEVISGPLVLGIMAAVGALGFAVSAINEYNEQQQTLQDATVGLTTAMQSSQTAYDQYIADNQESKKSVEELKDAIDQTIESQANLASQMNDAWGNIGTSEASVDMMVSKIAELSSKSRLMTDEQKELRATVEAFNNITGNSVKVLDAENSELDTSIAGIQRYADAWKASTENKQAVEDYGNIIQQLAQDEAALDEVNQKLESNDLSGGWFVDARDGANATSVAYSDLIQEQQRLEEAVRSGKEALQNSLDSMTDLGTQVAVVEDAFAETGDSLANYGSFTDDELQAIVDAFNDAGDGSISALDRVRAAIDGLRSGAADAESIAKSLEESSKAAQKALYNDTKAQYDEDYKNAKANYDNKYKALKAELDAEYKATQRNFDRQYKAAQKAYDAEYKAAQKAYDAEYKNRQKTYEKEYNGLKDRLDAEYKARKESYDRQLAALKKSQDAEVKAFEKATDAKLKAMEREYNQRVKLLEQQYGGKTDDIDERIAALKGETEAEKQAIETRNEEDKKAELQAAVENAKSRRKRAEAQKELNDYLQELQQKHNEQTREAEIERLTEQKDAIKEELDARKAALKEQYDAEVAAYKEQRAGQLEAMKEANTNEYEAKKAQFDAELEQLKANHTAQLEALKEAQTEQLEALKEAQTAQLEALKESQQESLQSIKDSQQAQLDSIKAANDQRLANL